MDFFVFFFFKREEQLYISSVFAIFIFLYVCVCMLDALYALSLSLTFWLEPAAGCASVRPAPEYTKP